MIRQIVSIILKKKAQHFSGRKIKSSLQEFGVRNFTYHSLVYCFFLKVTLVVIFRCQGVRDLLRLLFDILPSHPIHNEISLFFRRRSIFRQFTIASTESRVLSHHSRHPRLSLSIREERNEFRLIVHRPCSDYAEVIGARLTFAKCQFLSLSLSLSLAEPANETRAFRDCGRDGDAIDSCTSLVATRTCSAGEKSA